MKHSRKIDSHAELHAAAPGTRRGDDLGRVLGINWQTEIGVVEEIERLPVKKEQPIRKEAPMPPKVATGRPS